MWVGDINKNSFWTGHIKQWSLICKAQHVTRGRIKVSSATHRHSSPYIIKQTSWTIIVGNWVNSLAALCVNNMMMMYLHLKEKRRKLWMRSLGFADRQEMSNGEGTFRSSRTPRHGVSYADLFSLTLWTPNVSPVGFCDYQFLKEHRFQKGSQSSPDFPTRKSSMYVKMSMEHWWNDTDRGKPKYSEKNLSQWHLVQHTSHMYEPGMESGTPSERPATKPWQDLKRVRLAAATWKVSARTAQ